MDPLMGLACAMPLLFVGAVLLGLLLGLASWRRQLAAIEAVDRALAAAGLGPTDEPPWRIADVRGRICAVKPVRTARSRGGETRSVQLGVSLAALIPLDVPLVEHVYRNAGATSTELERSFYVQGGRPPADLPAAVAAGLVVWVRERPAERIEIGPRSSSALYAGRRLKDAVSVVRIDRPAPAPGEDLRRWLGEAVARVEAMEAADQR